MTNPITLPNDEQAAAIRSILRKWKFNIPFQADNSQLGGTILEFMEWSDSVLSSLHQCDETQAGLPGHPKVILFNSTMELLRIRTGGVHAPQA